MHLSAIKLRGFKSFPDPVEVRLEPGVAVVVGPNGSGKSNIADGLLWASGSLAPSELRAEKPDDVLFAGAPDRKAADFCEVELLFDNADGAFPELDFSEISIARRLHRGGEGQYIVNGATVRRLDLVELLADIGLGGSHGSVISQGRVEEVLASKPEERRALVEEAAGLGKFKSRRHRAELKLARVQTQVERARDLEAEVRKHLRPLALQATAAERAEKLRGEIAGLEARLAELDLEALGERVAEAESRRGAAASERQRVDERLEGVLAQRNRAEDVLADAAGIREAGTAALYRLRSAAERLELRREAAAALLERFQAEPPRRAPSVDAERLRTTRERLAAVERALAEREGLPPAARALTEEGERLVIDTLELAPGEERAAAAALRSRASALLAADAQAGLVLLERARERGLGSLIVLLDAPRLDLPVVPKDQLLASSVPAVTAEGFGYDPDRGELWFAGETAEAVWLELEARRRELTAEVERIANRPAAPPPATDPRLLALASRLVESLGGAAATASAFEEPLRRRADSGGARTGELATRLRELGAQEAEMRRVAGEVGQRQGAIEIELARLEAEAAEARRLEAAGTEPAEGDDREQLAERLERLRRRSETLGQVNPLAKEEYEAEKERLTELTTQREDLEKSLAELEDLRRELTETVERRFAETFAAVQQHFTEVAETLFPGGEGRLRLTEPEEEGGELGIEVELRPVGKRVTRLSLLSGGEKALGAISFLFALFLSRPCPFYLLDEVEAALDDTNIARFVELLRRYADRAQFIVVTHQKRTMEAADILYGVTMGGDGVSQIVSRRVPREQAAAVA
ncbi:MAG: AAA family ATPase [Actinomycetota bacterium]|nr:AAA family ATPase [Actinomycetota bacterium]